MKASIIDKIKKASNGSGCYIFRKGIEVLYVGKAANLRHRLKSYLKINDHKTEALYEEADRLDMLVLRSEIEALIEESRLIKELKPKYNVLWRDDKSYLYVALTREKYPKVFITHKSLNSKSYILNPIMIGPFTDGAALRLVMRLLRRYFPYCTCLRPHLRDCINAQIGKCLGFCCKKTDLTVIASLPAEAGGAKQSYNSANAGIAKEYDKNIKMIKAILRGQSKKLLKSLKDEKERQALKKIFQHQPYLTDSKLQIYPNLQKKYSEYANTFAVSDRIGRVECYDISHLAGKEAVGAMTVLAKKDGAWMADKSQWRKFKIKWAPTRDDPRMIAEVLTRRLNHSEWPYPNLIIIDGGLAQYHAALRAQAEKPEAKNIKIISFAKPRQKIIGIDDPSPELQKLVERAIYQTHNFVIRYHRNVRRREFLN